MGRQADTTALPAESCASPNTRTTRASAVSVPARMSIASTEGHTASMRITARARATRRASAVRPDDVDHRRAASQLDRDRRRRRHRGLLPRDRNECTALGVRPSQRRAVGLDLLRSSRLSAVTTQRRNRLAHPATQRLPGQPIFSTIETIAALRAVQTCHLRIAWPPPVRRLDGSRHNGRLP